MIKNCALSQPLLLWNKFKEKFTEDIFRRQRNKTDYNIYTDELFNITLIYIEDKLLSMGDIN